MSIGIHLCKVYSQEWTCWVTDYAYIPSLWILLNSFPESALISAPVSIMSPSCFTSSAGLGTVSFVYSKVLYAWSVACSLV